MTHRQLKKLLTGRQPRNQSCQQVTYTRSLPPDRRTDGRAPDRTLRITIERNDLLMVMAPWMESGWTLTRALWTNEIIDGDWLVIVSPRASNRGWGLRAIRKVDLFSLPARFVGWAVLISTWEGWRGQAVRSRAGIFYRTRAGSTCYLEGGNYYFHSTSKSYMSAVFHCQSSVSYLSMTAFCCVVDGWADVWMDDAPRWLFIFLLSKSFCGALSTSVLRRWFPKSFWNKSRENNNNNKISVHLIEL